MRVLTQWARWSITPLLFIGISGFLLATQLAEHPWILDGDWAGRTIASVIILACPLLAASAAYDVTHRMGPTLGELARSTSRGRLLPLLPGTVGALWCLAAMVLAYVVSISVVAANGGVPPRDFWLAPEIVFVLLAAAAVGTACGFRIQSFLAAPVAAGIVLLSAILGTRFGVKPFQVATNSGTMIGVERTPARAMISIALHLAIVALCYFLIRRTESPLASRSRIMIAVGFAPMALVLLVAALAPIKDSEYRPTRESVTCVGTDIRVCGPQRAQGVLALVREDFVAGAERLSSSNLPLPRTFVIARGDAVKMLGPSRTLLEFDPSTLRDGHLPKEVIATTLATPRACAALFEDNNASTYLDAISVVHDWILTALSAQSTPSAAPVKVQIAYQKLTTCPVIGSAS